MKERLALICVAAAAASGAGAVLPALGDGAANARAEAGENLPLKAREVAIFRAAFSGVPRASCVRRPTFMVCGDSATYHVTLRRVDACLLRIESGRYGDLPTRTRWVEGC